MVDDPNLVDRFREFREVRIKHDLRITVHQYLGEGEAYLDSEPPEKLAYEQRGREALSKLSSLGFPTPDLDQMLSKSKQEQLLNMMENLANMASSPFPESPHERIIDVQTEDKK